MVAFGALYCSAALVDFSGGATEAHFSFFVMVAMLAAYEEWVPYLLALVFVILHHGLLGVLDPSSRLRGREGDRVALEVGADPCGRSSSRSAW